MSTISLCMIVRNEQTILQKCLDSISWIADEIIITDTGSSDQTIDIAKQYTNNIQHFKWIDDFSAARNYTDQFATQEYILRWDADWILDPQSKKIFESLKAKNFHNNDLVYFNWILDFVPKTQKILRQEPYFFLYKNNLFKWQSPIHNQLYPVQSFSSIKELIENRINVYHYKDPSTKSHRYIQTDRILRQALADTKTADENYFRLLEFFGQNLVFLQKYQEAIDNLQLALTNPKILRAKKALILENLVFACIQTKQLILAQHILSQNYIPDQQRYWIIHGDVYALIDPDQAIESYQKAIQIGPNSPDLNHQRMLIHPRLMLAKLVILTRNPKNPTISLKYCIEHSRSPDSVQEAKQILSIYESNK